MVSPFLLPISVGLESRHRSNLHIDFLGRDYKVLGSCALRIYLLLAHMVRVGSGDTTNIPIILLFIFAPFSRVSHILSRGHIAIGFSLERLCGVLGLPHRAIAQVNCTVLLIILKGIVRSIRLNLTVWIVISINLPLTLSLGLFEGSRLAARSLR